MKRLPPHTYRNSTHRVCSICGKNGGSGFTTALRHLGYDVPNETMAYAHARCLQWAQNALKKPRPMKERNMSNEAEEHSPESFHAGFFRPSIHGRRVPVAELCAIDELRAARDADGETGMFRLVQQRWRERSLPRK